MGLRDDRCAYVADNPAKDFVSPHRLGVADGARAPPGQPAANFPSGGDIDASITSLDNLNTALAWDDSATSNHFMKLPRSRISCGLAIAPWNEVRSASSGG